MTYDLTGKRAIVTGASRGLGAAIAKAFEEAGCRALWKADCQDYDFRDPMAVSALCEEAIDVWGPFEILVNCAAMIGPVKPLIESARDEWEECMQVNLLAPVHLCRLFALWMRETKTPGSIINISGGGATSPRPNYSAYATAKCGLVRFSETLAMEVEQYGIRVNCVAPGLLNTAMGSPEGDPPERAAQLVTWLASDASRPITGRLISAKWDGWDKPGFVEAVKSTGKDLFTLRRIGPLEDYEV